VRAGSPTIAPASSTSAAASSTATPIPFKPVSQADATALGDGWLATVLVLVVLAAIAVLLRRTLTGLPRPRTG
jgi:hypothetical protein